MPLQVRTEGEARIAQLHAEIQELVDQCDTEKQAQQEELSLLRHKHEEEVSRRSPGRAAAVPVPQPPRVVVLLLCLSRWRC
jgi:hypothetical protein